MLKTERIPSMYLGKKFVLLSLIIPLIHVHLYTNMNTINSLILQSSEFWSNKQVGWTERVVPIEQFARCHVMVLLATFDSLVVDFHETYQTSSFINVSQYLGAWWNHRFVGNHQLMVVLKAKKSSIFQKIKDCHYMGSLFSLPIWKKTFLS